MVHLNKVFLELVNFYGSKCDCYSPGSVLRSLKFYYFSIPLGTMLPAHYDGSYFASLSPRETCESFFPNVELFCFSHDGYKRAYTFEQLCNCNLNLYVRPNRAIENDFYKLFPELKTLKK